MATTQPENNEHTQNGVKNGNGQSKEKSFIKVPEYIPAHFAIYI